jgi:uncharacterized protein involved in exopolysaccharide biosynthesis
MLTFNRIRNETGSDRGMKWFSILLLVGIAMAAGAGASAFFSTRHFKRFEAVAEISINSEVLSSAGMAQLRRIDPRQGTELLDVTQFLLSRTAAEYAATKVTGYSAENIQETISVRPTPGSSVLQLRAIAQTEHDAKTIGAAILESSKQAEQQARRDKMKALLGSLKKQKSASYGRLEYLSLGVESGVRIAETQKRMHDLSINLVALTARYANNYPKVINLRREQDRLKEIVSEQQKEQRQILQNLRTEEAEKIVVGERPPQRESKPNVEPEADLEKLLTERDSERSNFEQLSRRFMEIQIYSETFEPGFSVISLPSISKSALIKKTALAAVVGAIAGFLLISPMVVLLSRHKSRTS